MSYDQRLNEAIRTIADLFRANASLNARCATLTGENAKLRASLKEIRDTTKETRTQRIATVALQS